VKIMDFGLAKLMEEVRNATTMISGTPFYMSPEQTLGRDVDHRTDVYSLGVTIFESRLAAAVPGVRTTRPYAPADARLKADVPALLAEIVPAACARIPTSATVGARDPRRGACRDGPHARPGQLSRRTDPASSL
jgi:serine/threonine protein kinase